MSNSNNKVVYGIDLGTTNSCIAVVDPASGKAYVVNNKEAVPTTPSVVYIKDGRTAIVGANAENQLGSRDAKNVIVGSKRHLAEDAEWTPDGKFKGAEYPVFNEEKTSPITAAALILRKVVMDNPNLPACNGGEKPSAVVTVPAHFSPGGKTRTQQSVFAAGLNLLGMIEEPVAAALAYHNGSACKNSNVFVYDWGGGTFDATIVQFNEKGVGQVLVKKGDAFLGGNDVDNSLGFHIWREYAEQKRSPVTLSEDTFRNPEKARNNDVLRMVNKFRRLAREAKHALTTLGSYDVVIDDGDVVIPLTRTEFESCIVRHVEGTLEIVRSVFSDDRAVTPEKIDEVILVGGSSIMPCVKLALEKAYPAWRNKILLSDPHEAVAKGAAIWANILANGGGEIEVRNYTERSYGIKCVKRGASGGDEYYVSNLIKLGATIPVCVTDRFSTYKDRQRDVAIQVFDNESKMSRASLEESREIVNPASNRLCFEKEVPEDTPIEITLSLDESGLLDVQGKSLVDSGACHFTLHVTGTLDEKGMDSAKKQIAAGTVQ